MSLNIQYITITGADNEVDINDLVSLAKDHPKVEWGILLTSKLKGYSRYPSIPWLQKLHKAWQEHDLSLSGHICGSWIWALSKGSFDLMAREDTKDIQKMFNRIQLNFHGDTQLFTDDFWQILKKHPRKYIFQMDVVNNWVFMKALDSIKEAYPLFDTSHGGGILPNKWPTPCPGVLTGYAGGLSPENVDKQLGKIAETVGNEPIWVDVETGVRTADDEFDLGKVVRFITAVEGWL